MLNRIEIKNYRCFPHLDVELRPLTVLIGANNTGKSAFLDAIRSLGNKIPLTSFDQWRLAPESDIQIRGNFPETSNLVVTQTEDQGKYSRTRGVALEGVAYFRLPSSGVSSMCQGFSESEVFLPLGEEGENLAAVLDAIYRKDRIVKGRKRFDSIVETLRELVPGFEDIVITTPDAQTRHLNVISDNGLQLPGESLSVGLRHLIFFVTLAHHPKPPHVVLIEEPELGVHPKRLSDILRLLRSISQGEFCNHPAQVILTTHSPFLLDHVDLEKDQLLIFQREDEINGARTVKPADKERLKIFLDEFMLGEVWYNESEEGLVKQR